MIKRLASGISSKSKSKSFIEEQETPGELEAETQNTLTNQEEEQRDNAEKELGISEGEEEKRQDDVEEELGIPEDKDEQQEDAAEEKLQEDAEEALGISEEEEKQQDDAEEEEKKRDSNPRISEEEEEEGKEEEEENSQEDAPEKAAAEEAAVNEGVWGSVWKAAAGEAGAAEEQQKQKQPKQAASEAASAAEKTTAEEARAAEEAAALKIQSVARGGQGRTDLDVRKQVFLQFDMDKDGWLNQAEMFEFAKNLGFPDNAVAWEQEYKEVCRQHGFADKGVTESQFLWLTKNPDEQYWFDAMKFRKGGWAEACADFEQVYNEKPMEIPIQAKIQGIDWTKLEGMPELKKLVLQNVCAALAERSGVNVKDMQVSLTPTP